MPSWIENYERVERNGSKAGKCVVCGKRATRQTTFGQTLNPYNRNAQGEVKTRLEIGRELNAQVVAWEAEPVKHAGCEL